MINLEHFRRMKANVVIELSIIIVYHADATTISSST